ncbi:MAG: YgiQ family radical SAM protein [Desulfobacteraceae bacterium]|nr:MAG: YgiQ family radical SAM protein [Desulfobacteraceae bacterium]
MFIPTTKEEIRKLGWESLDVILLTGDSYIDSPFVGVSVIGKLLIKEGFRTGIIGQPDINSGTDICRLGEPGLFWGITGGCIDSIVANYTASNRRRMNDDYTAGGDNIRRPDRAVIAYSNLIRKYFKNTKPLVLGGMEASLRRIPHYDSRTDHLRRSILFDAKADYIIYGMGEKTAVELAKKMKSGKETRDLPGICYAGKEKPEGYIELPSYEVLLKEKTAFIDMFNIFYRNNDPVTAKGLCLRHDNRYLIHNPPASCLSTVELDEIYDMDFERDLHPFHKNEGRARALETIKFSISTHRGCYGECNFCAISVHEGRTVSWRSEESIISEAKRMASHPDFKGYILDVGGPTANMYGFECEKKLSGGSCADRRCIHPKVCPKLKPDHGRQISLLANLRKIKGIKKIFISSGIRYDLLLSDKTRGEKYLKEIVRHHVSGQLKIAPEHTEEKVLQKMGKPGTKPLLEFVDLFNRLTKEAGKEQYLTYYFMAAHPGCKEEDMKKLKSFISRNLKINPEQVQIFTPSPSTYSTLMYYTGMDPFTKDKIYIEKDVIKKEKQKSIITSKGTHRYEKA